MRNAQLVIHELQEQPASLVGAPQVWTHKRRFRFPQDIVGMPLLLPSLENSLRDSFDQQLLEAGIRPHIRAEVDDMALLRLVASHSPDCLALVPPVVVRDELAAGSLVEHCCVEAMRQRFYAITRTRVMPHPDLPTVLPDIAANLGRRKNRRTTAEQPLKCRRR